MALGVTVEGDAVTVRDPVAAVVWAVLAAALVAVLWAVAGWFAGGSTAGVIAASLAGVVVGLVALRRCITVSPTGIRERRWFDVREMRWQNLVLVHVGPVGSKWNAQVVAVFSRIGSARELPPTRARSTSRVAAIQSIVAGITAVPTQVDGTPWRAVRVDGAQPPATRDLRLSRRRVVLVAFAGLGLVRCAQLTSAVGGPGPRLPIEVSDVPRFVDRPPPFPPGEGRTFSAPPFLATMAGDGPTSFFSVPTIDTTPSATFTVTIRGAGHVVTVDCP